MYDIDGSNGKSNDRSGLENDLDMNMSIIPLTQHAAGVPHVINDGHADHVVDHDQLLNMVSDGVELPSES